MNTQRITSRDFNGTLDIDFRKNLSSADQRRKARVYFFHKGENVMEDLVNRWARPADFYRTLLPEVEGFLGRTGLKFRWSQKAGCSCGCSPGFICDNEFGAEIYCTLSPDAPHVDPTMAAIVQQRAELLGLVADEVEEYAAI